VGRPQEMERIILKGCVERAVLREHQTIVAASFLPFAGESNEGGGTVKRAHHPTASQCAVNPCRFEAMATDHGVDLICFTVVTDPT